MFPEFRDLITQLKTTDHHFTRLFDKHNALDHRIRAMEGVTVSETNLLLSTRKAGRR